MISLYACMQREVIQQMIQNSNRKSQNNHYLQEVFLTMNIMLLNRPFVIYINCLMAQLGMKLDVRIYEYVNVLVRSTMSATFSGVYAEWTQF